MQRLRNTPPPITRKLPDFRNLGVLLLVNLLAAGKLGAIRCFAR